MSNEYLDDPSQIANNIINILNKYDDIINISDIIGIMDHLRQLVALTGSQKNPRYKMGGEKLSYERREKWKPLFGFRNPL